MGDNLLSSSGMFPRHASDDDDFVKYEYSLFFLLPGTAGVSHFHLRSSIAEKFHVHEALARQPPSHLTLKYNFQASVFQLNELQMALDDLASNLRAAPMRVGGYGHFSNNVIFTEVHRSEEVEKAVARFLTCMRSLEWMTWKQLTPDKTEMDELHLHATLAYKDIGPKFDEIWAWLHEGDRAKQHHDVLFDHIALCSLDATLENPFWQVDKVYFFQPPECSLSTSLDFDETVSHVPDLAVARTVSAASVLTTAAEEMLDNAVVFHSSVIDSMVHLALTRHVEGLEEWGVRFIDIFNIIIQQNQRAFVYGGFLRDLFTTGSLSDDIDVLFTCSCEALVEVCKARGWPYYLKKHPDTGEFRYDFIAIGKKGAKGKFSGHVYGTGCEGDFALNTLIYDVQGKHLVDPTGYGCSDAAHGILRFPFCFTRNQWDEGVDTDRLLGMRLLRFFNFAARGYVPVSPTFRNFMVRRLRELAEGGSDALARTLETFMERKLVKETRHESHKCAGNFSSALIECYDASYGGGGELFYQTHLLPTFERLFQAAHGSA
eukprot:TRINITY_DN6912_c0_g1_i1.p1 TRINITY_DN6912_c0_g1~~TRINITY_DN6912_c0_g1_i1.p1  ORF type:complete len:545 (+),score=184.50 TRINITY_DN6912_c0_g1_i1:79-1713(+)